MVICKPPKVSASLHIYNLSLRHSYNIITDQVKDLWPRKIYPPGGYEPVK